MRPDLSRYALRNTVKRFNNDADTIFYRNVPFTINANKPLFAAKVAIFFGTGFSIPFVAAWYEFSRATIHRTKNKTTDSIYRWQLSKVA